MEYLAGFSDKRKKPELTKLKEFDEMCGIFGLYSRTRADQESVRRSMDCLSHRGPDARGMWVSDDMRLVLAHARLKIIDLSDSANQPMVSPDGRWVLVYNGEIFNYSEVRRNYRGPWKFRTSSDSEVLLATFAREGPAALSRWVGMFAFALVDCEEGKLYLVRDRFGIKPLYWVRTRDGGFAFASEIPALLPLLASVAEDRDVIRTYLEIGTCDFGTRSFFSGVNALKPGHLTTIDLATGSWTESCWYRLADHVPDLSGIDESSLLEQGRSLVDTAIHDHLTADVPVGLNVSGGVDSSLLVNVSKRYVGDIHVFTQDYAAPYSEADWVRQVADGCHLHLQSLGSDDIRAVLNDAVRWQAEPFGGVTVCGYDAVYRAADQSGIVVLLDGNGVDEVFLGYDKYVTDWRDDRNTTFDDIVIRSTGRAIDGSLAVDVGVISEQMRKSTQLIHVPLALDEFADVSKAMAAADLLRTKIPRGLRFNDRMSMARSKELRVPFLDHRLVEFGFGVPTKFLLNRNGGKTLFRQIAENWIPPQVAWAAKRSVQSPQREWLADDWQDFVRSILTSRSFGERGWIDPRRAMRSYETFRATRANSNFVWQWLNLELWARAFLD